MQLKVLWYNKIRLKGLTLLFIGIRSMPNTLTQNMLIKMLKGKHTSYIYMFTFNLLINMHIIHAVIHHSKKYLNCT